MKDIINQIIQNDPSILTLAIKAVLLIILFILAAVAKRIDNKLNINLHDSVLKQIEYVINSIVIYMNQTTVDNLKLNSDNGKLDINDQCEVFDKVKHLIKQSLTPEQIKVLETLYPSVEAALEILIEKSVNNNKTSCEQYQLLDSCSEFNYDNYGTVTDFNDIKIGNPDNEIKEPIEISINDTGTLVDEEPKEKPKKKRTRKTKKTDEEKKEE